MFNTRGKEPLPRKELKSAQDEQKTAKEEEAKAWQESTWNPDAKSFDGQHGKGVMQIDDRSHDFARAQGVFDPAKNIEYGARYLSGLKDQYGSWQEALHHYNGGSTYAGKIMGLAGSQPWTHYV